MLQGAALLVRTTLVVVFQLPFDTAVAAAAAVCCDSYKSPGEAYVEGDASSASYFLAGATITGGTVTVEGCGSDSLQVGGCR